MLRTVHLLYCSRWMGEGECGMWAAAKKPPSLLCSSTTGCHFSCEHRVAAPSSVRSHSPRFLALVISCKLRVRRGKGAICYGWRPARPCEKLPSQQHVTQQCLCCLGGWLWGAAELPERMALGAVYGWPVPTLFFVPRQTSLDCPANRAPRSSLTHHPPGPPPLFNSGTPQQLRP